MNNSVCIQATFEKLLSDFSFGLNWILGQIPDNPADKIPDPDIQ